MTSRRMRGAGALRAIVRPAFPDLEAKGEFIAAMRALGAGGVREAAFYNWGICETRISHGSQRA